MVTNYFVNAEIKYHSYSRAAGPCLSGVHSWLIAVPSTYRHRFSLMLYFSPSATSTSFLLPPNE